MAQAYKVDFTTRTITITAEFERAMSNPEAKEYTIRPYDSEETIRFVKAYVRQ